MEAPESWNNSDPIRTGKTLPAGNTGFSLALISAILREVDEYGPSFDAESDGRKLSSFCATEVGSCRVVSSGDRTVCVTDGTRIAADLDDSLRPTVDGRLETEPEEEAVLTSEESESAFLFIPASMDMFVDAE
jgi:hypothetical protein